ncbi:MAG: hypothetical protein ACI82H_001880 [Alphaproteobacteria bacterium]|jgi:hypothetical protein
MTSPLPAEPSAKLAQDDSAPDAHPSATSLLSGAAASNDAATLTANLVQRGRNPWWGKDQAPAAVPASAVPNEPDGPLLGTPLPRTDTSYSTGHATKHTTRHTTRLPLGGFNRALWRDVIVFLTVFAAGLTAMLFLPFRAL